MKEILKQSLNYSLLTQLVTLFVNFFGLTKKLDPKHAILTEILGLETIVQIIELIFYAWYKQFIMTGGPLDVTRFRYYDWVLTTPMMLFSTICYYVYLKYQETDGNPLKISEVFSQNKGRILLILFLNLLMLIFGYLQEIGVISIYTSSIFGYLALMGSFYGIYDGFVRDVKDKKIFNFMFFVWSLYGIAATFSSIPKNIGYNILDIFAKNFYGVYLSYLISVLK